MAKAHYDHETPNKSFREVYNYLEELGVKKSEALLIADKAILSLGINAYSKNLTEEEQQRVIEATKNPWYVLRELIRIPRGATKRYYELRREFVGAFYNAFEYPETTPILGSTHRQMGVTTALAAMAIALNKRVLILSSTKSNSILLKKRIEQLVSTMPVYLHEHFMNRLDIRVGSTYSTDSINAAINNNSDVELIINHDYEYTKLTTNTFGCIRSAIEINQQLVEAAFEKTPQIISGSSVNEGLSEKARNEVDSYYAFANKVWGPPLYERRNVTNAVRKFGEGLEIIHYITPQLKPTTQDFNITTSNK